MSPPTKFPVPGATPHGQLIAISKFMRFSMTYQLPYLLMLPVLFVVR